MRAYPHSAMDNPKPVPAISRDLACPPGRNARIPSICVPEEFRDRCLEPRQQHRHYRPDSDEDVSRDGEYLYALSMRFTSAWRRSRGRLDGDQGTLPPSPSDSSLPPALRVNRPLLGQSKTGTSARWRGSRPHLRGHREKAIDQAGKAIRPLPACCHGCRG